MVSPLNKRICVAGMGYIGLPTAAVLASRGYAVHGFEVNAQVVETVNAGKTHIVEPDLDILVRAAVQTDMLKAHTEPAEADIFIICVPTPTDRDRAPDLSYVEAAAGAICSYLKSGNLVILESTSPPGTTELLAELIEKQTSLAPPEIYVAHAPERVLPGKILREVVENDRIIGGINDSSTQQCADFYRTFVAGELHLTHCRTAETVKLVENAFRDVNIAFANELAKLGEELELDVREVIRLANHHPRVNILSPGCGVGGHCLAVDPWFLIHRVPKVTRLMQTARLVNDAQPDWVVDRVLRHVKRFKQPHIACLGLAYKPDIDDLRESPALEIALRLKKADVGVLHVVEPNLTSHPEFELVDLDQAVAQADIVLFLVDHRPFKRMAANLLAEKIVIDTCGTTQAANH